MNIDRIVALVRETGAHSATYYETPRLVTRVTRFAYHGKFHARKTDPLEFRLHIGPPNCTERDFIKAAKRAGKPFPVKKPQLRFLPKKRK